MFNFKYKISLIALLIIVVIADPAWAQKENKDNSDPDLLLEQADTAFNNKQYQECAESNLAAIKAGAKYTIVFFNAATCLAMAGRIDEAFQYLNSAIDDGYIKIDVLKSDKNLASLRTDSRWQAVIDKCQAELSKLNQPLRQELFEMTRVDQEIRNKLIQQGNQANKELIEEVDRIDKKNTARMREIVKQYGWPGKSLVGKDGASAAWLLVQHADRDREFQKECLQLMKVALEKGEVNRPNFALLTDRVLLAEGKKQLYGSQFQLKDGEYVPSPIEDEANVDARRREMGLEPLADYAKKIREIYQSDSK